MNQFVGVDLVPLFLLRYASASASLDCDGAADRESDVAVRVDHKVTGFDQLVEIRRSLGQVRHGLRKFDHRQAVTL